MIVNAKCRECKKNFLYDPENGERFCCSCNDEIENRKMDDPEYRKEIEECNRIYEMFFPSFDFTVKCKECGNKFYSENTTEYVCFDCNLPKEERN